LKLRGEGGGEGRGGGSDLGWGGGEVTGFCGGGGCSAERVGGKLNRSGGREGGKIFGRKRRECPQIWACGPEPH
jgi:hypothetical protein